MKNYYEILGIGPDATEDDIKKAFRLSAIKYHPDKHFGDKYFEEKFKLVNEAYSILIDQNSRVDYDAEWNTIFGDLEEKITPKDNFDRNFTYREDNEFESKFFYNPQKPFYSHRDRELQETPQYAPLFNHWGEKIDDNADFFILPKKIGKLISGYTTMKKDDKPLTKRMIFWNISRRIIIGSLVGSLVVFAFGVKNPVGILILVLIPALIGFVRGKSACKFSHLVNYIGINGFAEFECEGNRKNIVRELEINFNEVTDLISVTTIDYRNNSYMWTTVKFVWLNSEEVLLKRGSFYSSKENNPARSDTDFWLNTIAEKYWTVYLLDNMESKLQNNGYLEFNLFNEKNDKYVKIPYIRLGIGYMTVFSRDKSFTYKFDEIKKVYIKNMDMFIEHKNYEKKFFFFRSGNSDKIPLQKLSNRLFFFRALDLLLGVKFN